MNQSRHVTYLLATALTASLAFFGCSKDDEKKSGGAASSGAKAAFSVFPKSTSMVIGLNIGEITSSALYEKFKPMLESQMASAGDTLSELKEKCGIDPFTDFKSVIAGMEIGADMEPDDKTVVAVVKGPSRSKLVECGNKMAKEDGATLTDEGKFTKIEKAGEDTKWIGWMDDNTLVIAPEMDKAMLETRLAGKDGLDGNAEMIDLLGNTDMGSALWFAMAPPGGIKSPTGGMGMPMPEPSAAFGTVALGGGLAIDFGMRLDSGDTADKMAKELETQMKQMAPMLGPASKYVEKVKLSAKGKDLVIAIKLSVKDVEEIMALAGGMF